MTVTALVLAWLIGWAWVRGSGVTRGVRPTWAALMFEASAGLAAGLGVTSIVFTCLLWAGINSAAVQWSIEAALLAAGAFFAWRQRGGEPAAEAAPPFRWNWALAAVFLLAALIYSVAYWKVAAGNPHGNWDAWAIWNLRAKFLTGGLDTWRLAVSPELSHTHPEYPLLWPGAIARAWRPAGSAMPAFVPQIAAFAVSLCLSVAAVGAVAAAGSPALGWMAGILVLTPRHFGNQAQAQYADLPLALLMTASLGSVLLGKKQGWGRGGLVLSGALASMAAYTKNEGVAFLAAMALTVGWAARARAVWWVLGAVPVAALTAAFKILLAPKGEIARWGLLGDLGRLGSIIPGMLGAFSGPGVLAIAAAAALLGVERPVKMWWAAAPGVLLLGADVLAMWVSPNGVEWQLATAVDRLIIQAWPLLAVGVLAMLKAPATEEAVRPAERKKKKR